MLSFLFGACAQCVADAVFSGIKQEHKQIVETFHSVSRA